jgi:hypothetical protein
LVAKSLEIPVFGNVQEQTEPLSSFYPERGGRRCNKVNETPSSMDLDFESPLEQKGLDDLPLKFVIPNRTDHDRARIEVPLEVSWRR